MKNMLELEWDGMRPIITAAQGLCRKPVHLRLHSRPIHAKLCEIRVIGRRNPPHGIDPGRLSNTSTADEEGCGMLWPKDANGFWNLNVQLLSRLSRHWQQPGPGYPVTPIMIAPCSCAGAKYSGTSAQHMGMSWDLRTYWTHHLAGREAAVGMGRHFKLSMAPKLHDNGIQLIGTVTVHSWAGKINTCWSLQWWAVS